MQEPINPDAIATDLRALAHEKRVRMLHFLLEPRSLEEIASHLGVARQTAHEHLQHLLETGLVVRLGTDQRSMTFASVPQRLFQLYETIGRLGSLETRHDERAVSRLATEPDRPAAGPARDDDLPRLTIVHGMRIGQRILLQGDGPWVIGRDPAATVCVDYDVYASTRHAEVRRAPGGFALADLYSSNGTTLDWRPVQRGGQEPLPNGCIVGVGRTLLSFRKP